MPKRVYVDDDGLTELGRRWRSVAIAHEAFVHAAMFDLVRYRLELGKDLHLGAMPANHDRPPEVHPEPAPAPD
jgi:hypothetical protein